MTPNPSDYDPERDTVLRSCREAIVLARAEQVVRRAVVATRAATCASR